MAFGNKNDEFAKYVENAIHAHGAWLEKLKNHGR